MASPGAGWSGSFAHQHPAPGSQLKLAPQRGHRALIICGVLRALLRRDATFRARGFSAIGWEWASAASAGLKLRGASAIGLAFAAVFPGFRMVIFCLCSRPQVHYIPRFGGNRGIEPLSVNRFPPVAAIAAFVLSPSVVSRLFHLNSNSFKWRGRCFSLT